MSQELVLRHLKVGEEKTAFEIAEEAGATPNHIHKGITRLMLWHQVERVGSVWVAKTGSPRAIYRRLW